MVKSLERNATVKLSQPHMPTRQEVMELATELFYQEAFKHDCKNPNTPEDQELLEGGFYQTAKSMLMADRARAETEQYNEYADQAENFADFKFNVEQSLEKGTTIVGGRGCGKTNTAKQIVKKLQDHGYVIRVYDNSQAWRQSSVKNLVMVTPNNNFEPVYSESYVFDISLLSIEDQKEFIETQISNDYYEAVAQSEAERTWRVYVFEEAELTLGKNRSPTMLQFCSIGRNFKLSFVAVAQRFQMLNTDLISLSGQLYCGCFHEDNDLKKLKNWLGAETERLKKLELGQFAYYSDGKIELMQCDKFTDNVETVNIQPTTTPQPLPNTQPIQTKADYTLLLKFAFMTIIGIVFIWGLL
jgi:hypothetical protein